MSPPRPTQPPSAENSAELAFKRAQWLLTEPTLGKALDFTVRSGPHSIRSSALERLPPEISSQTQAEVLDLRRTRVASLDPIAGFKNLQQVYLDDTSVEDLGPLSECHGLRELRCPSTRVADLSPIRGATSLKELHIGRSKVSDIRVLSEFPNLEILYAGNTAIDDLAALRNCPKLRMVLVNGTLIRNVDALSELTELKNLDVERTLVTTLAPLKNLVSLIGAAETADLWGVEFEDCPLEDAEVLAFANLRNPSRTRRTINYYRIREGLPPAGDWQNDAPLARPAASLPDASELPQHSVQSLGIQANSDGALDLAPPPGADDEQVTARRRAAMAEDSFELALECEKGGNDVNVHSAPLRRLSDALKDPTEDLVILRLRMSRVMSIHDAHIARAERPYHEWDAPPLPDGIASRLKNMRGDIHALINSDSRLLELERARVGMNSHSSAPGSTARAILDAARSTPGLLSAKVQSRLDEIQLAAEPPPGSLELPSTEAADTLGHTGEEVVVTVAREVVSALEPVRAELERIASAQEAGNNIQAAAAVDKSAIKRVKERLVDLGFTTIAMGATGTYVAFLVAQGSNIIGLAAQNPAFEALARLVSFLLRLFG